MLNKAIEIANRDGQNYEQLLTEYLPMRLPVM